MSKVSYYMMQRPGHYADTKKINYWLQKLIFGEEQQRNHERKLKPEN